MVEDGGGHDRFPKRDHEISLLPIQILMAVNRYSGARSKCFISGIALESFALIKNRATWHLPWKRDKDTYAMKLRWMLVAPLLPLVFVQPSNAMTRIAGDMGGPVGDYLFMFAA